MYGAYLAAEWPAFRHVRVVRDGLDDRLSRRIVPSEGGTTDVKRDLQQKVAVAPIGREAVFASATVGSDS